MADERDKISWHSPDPRAVIPLDNYNIPRSTKGLVKARTFDIMIDTAFEEVMRGCANRIETWINEEIIESYIELHRLGFAHSVESTVANPVNGRSRILGGLYGVALGYAFFGESMYSLESGASKAALGFLIKHLSDRGFTLLDIQYMTPHLKTFGAVELPKRKYIQLLQDAMARKALFVDHLPA